MSDLMDEQIRVFARGPLTSRQLGDQQREESW